MLIRNIKAWSRKHVDHRESSLTETHRHRTHTHPHTSCGQEWVSIRYWFAPESVWVSASLECRSSCWPRDLYSPQSPSYISPAEGKTHTALIESSVSVSLSWKSQILNPRSKKHSVRGKSAPGVRIWWWWCFILTVWRLHGASTSTSTGVIWRCVCLAFPLITSRTSAEPVGMRRTKVCFYRSDPFGLANRENKSKV